MSDRFMKAINHEGLVFDELIAFEDFLSHCEPRPRAPGDTGHQWSLTFRGHAVAPNPDKKKYQICLRGFCVHFDARHMVMVADGNKVLIRTKDKVAEIMGDTVGEPTQTSAPVYRREDVFQAMRESGFERFDSCCDFSLGKMCNIDRYKGDLEAFVKTYLRISGYRP